MELVVDNRERYVIEEFEKNGYPITTKQMTTADFAIINGDKIIAIFERKTLKDYASSIIDGRHQNKQKLIDMRAETGCDVYYIIESTYAHPKLTQRFSNMPYKNIYSSILHLMVRDKFFVVQTKSPENTTQHLIDLLNSYIKFPPTIKAELPKNEAELPKNEAELPMIENKDGGVELPKNEVELPKNEVELPKNEAVKLLIAPKIKSDEYILMSMWTSLYGVGEEIAIQLGSQMTIKEFFTSSADVKKIIENLFYKSGRKVAAATLRQLCKLKHEMKIKIISNIPTISKNRATAIIEMVNIAEIEDDSKLRDIMSGTKKIGKKAEENIIYFTNLKFTK